MFLAKYFEVLNECHKDKNIKISFKERIGTTQLAALITEDKKEQEGYDGREITIKRDVHYKDGSVYTDFIESRYEPNDDITLTCGGDSCYSVPPGAADGVHNQDEMINKRYDPLGP